jgi:isoquinoline 1-oxidoreductase alpha subunit
MTAAHLLKQSSRPTESEIRAALNDCLCRCGAYPRIVRAVQRAAEMSGSTKESA